MSALRHDGARRLQDERDTLARLFDYELEYLPTDAVRERLNSSRYFQALRDPNAFHFHPLNYLRALAEAAEGSGGRIFEGSRAVSADLDGPARSSAPRRARSAPARCVFCGGGYTDRLVPELRRAHAADRDLRHADRGSARPHRRGDPDPDAIGDNRRAGDYYRVVDGGERILWGGRITTRTAEPRNLAELLRRDMIATYPQLDGVRGGGRLVRPHVLCAASDAPDRARCSRASGTAPPLAATA